MSVRKRATNGAQAVTAVTVVADQVEQGAERAAIEREVAEQIEACRRTPDFLEGFDDGSPALHLTVCAVCGQYKDGLCRFGRPQEDDSNRAMIMMGVKRLTEFVNFCESHGARVSRLGRLGSDLPIAKQLAERALRTLRTLV